MFQSTRDHHQGIKVIQHKTNQSVLFTVDMWRRVKWLKCRHFFVELLYKCDGCVKESKEPLCTEEVLSNSNMGTE